MTGNASQAIALFVALHPRGISSFECPLSESHDEIQLVSTVDHCQERGFATSQHHLRD
ncbi:hypothetical protein EXIGLDRAFT_784527 [Exidia glandulosa HHB12029]|uniref:Uncharacterized protein n=1 Tax=Exidia glandulosa HHB12029 TaxID=1314781 RepID=A0A166MES4_EXIGL|nr:hypothetical protein EXIGLDRAFT_784527 [Exidia glandulosa HHB12029]